MRKLYKNYSLHEYKSFSNSLLSDATGNDLYSLSIEDGKLLTYDAKPNFETLNRMDKWRQFVLNVKNFSCPYCDISKIFKDTSYGTSDIDHIHSKRDFPSLAVSYNNLLPCCAICNRKKSSSSFDINPLNHEFNDVEFLLKVETGRITKVLVWSKNAAIDEQIKILGLQGRYNSDAVLHDLNMNLDKLKQWNTIGKKNINEWEYLSSYGNLVKYCSENQCITD